MDQLFELPTSRKLMLLSKEGLMDYIQHYSASIAQLRKQLLDLQRENERLRGELGYGQTVAMQFREEKGTSRGRTGKKNAS